MTIKIGDINSQQEIKCLKWHIYPVISICFSPCGKYIASKGKYHGINIWNIAAQKQEIELIEDFSGANTVIYSPCGKYIAWCPYGSIKIWSIEAHQLFKKFSFKDYFYSVAYSPCGKYLAASRNPSQGILILDIETQGIIKYFIGHTRSIKSICYSPCGKYIVSGSDDFAIKIGDINAQKEIYELKGHTNNVNSVAFSPCGKYIISGSADKTIKMWSIHNLFKIQAEQNSKSAICSLEWSSMIDQLYILD